MVKIRYRFEAEPTGKSYAVRVRTAWYPFNRWREAGTLTLTKEEWEALRGMLGRFTVSVDLDEPQPV